MQVGTVVVMGNDGGPPTTASDPQPPRAAGDVPLGAGVPRRDRGGRATAGRGLRLGRRRGDRRVPGRPPRAADPRDDVHSCGRTLVPPRKFCERCFRPTDGWTEVPHTGTVETFSICHVTWDMQPLDEPQIPAVIRLDGTSEGGFLHLLGEAPDDVRAGMQVEAVWKPMDERSGRSWTSRTSDRPSPSSGASSSRSPPSRRRWDAREPDEDPRRAVGLVPYTPGVGNTAFFEALRDRGVFLGSRCASCG